MDKSPCNDLYCRSTREGVCLWSQGGGQTWPGMTFCPNVMPKKFYGGDEEIQKAIHLNTTVKALLK